MHVMSTRVAGHVAIGVGLPTDGKFNRKAKYDKINANLQWLLMSWDIGLLISILIGDITTDHVTRW